MSKMEYACRKCGSVKVRRRVWPKSNTTQTCQDCGFNDIIPQPKWLDEAITSGKYAGKTVRYVICEAPEYILTATKTFPGEYWRGVFADAARYIESGFDKDAGAPTGSGNIAALKALQADLRELESRLCEIITAMEQ